MMEELRVWFVRQFEDRLVEPNSALGAMISYMLKYWDRLTLFLRVPGAPLDNNICERALKRAILHRKNALFYKTCRGARVGDLFMSLIHTCQLCGANAFDYLTELERHAGELSAGPEQLDAVELPGNARRRHVSRPLLIPAPPVAVSAAATKVLLPQQNSWVNFGSGSLPRA